MIIALYKKRIRQNNLEVYMESYIPILNKNIEVLFKDALKIAYKNPALSLFLIKTLKNQNTAAKLRYKMEQNNIHVPPFMIFSLTKKCNLNCAGCYAKETHKDKEPDLTAEEIKDLLHQASDIGISIILMAGGEPFMLKELLDITDMFPKIIFPVFTNGLLLNDEKITKLKKQKHVIPIISIEGKEKETDCRRGAGVHKTAIETFKRLSKENVFFGVSITTTSENKDLVTSDSYIKEIMQYGCKLFIYVEYVPFKEGTEYLVPGQEIREELRAKVVDMKKQYPSLFVLFPGEEEDFGGCLSAGRGFFHVSSSGNFEPCPFAPYSSGNIRTSKLIDGINSPFFMEIRKNHDKLSEDISGCALFDNKEWVQSLLHNKRLALR